MSQVEPHYCYKLDQKSKGLTMPVFKRPGAAQGSEASYKKGADNAMLTLLSFDKNKDFTLESGQFVSSCKMHQVKCEHKSDLETYTKALDGLASPEKKNEVKDLNGRTGTAVSFDKGRYSVELDDAKEEGKLDSESKIMPVNQAPYQTSPEPTAEASTPDKMAQEKDVAPAKGKRSHCLSRAPTPKLVVVTADVQGLVYTDHIEDVPTSQPTDYGILDQQGDGESSSGGLLYQRNKRRRPVESLSSGFPPNDIGGNLPQV